MTAKTAKTAKTASRKAPPKSKAKAKSPIADALAEVLATNRALDAAAKSSPKAPAEPKANKSAALRQLIQRPEGATLAEMMDASGWQKHTIRAFLSRGGGSTKAPGPKVMRDVETGRYRQPAE